MDITKIPLFDTMRERMSYLSARQTVLAENVANANTPGYAAQDIEAPDFGSMTDTAFAMASPSLATTDPHHISASSTEAGGGFKIMKQPGSESTPNGNSVNLEEQMMKVSSVQMDYATITQLYKKAMSMIRMAAGGQR